MRFIGDDVANGNIGAAQQRRPTKLVGLCCRAAFKSNQNPGRAELLLRWRRGTAALPNW
jgi:hypothetical protein